MNLLAAELLVVRKRAATYVVLGVLLAVMVLVFLLIGLRGSAFPTGLELVRFPGVYALISQFVFALGSLLAVAYTAAMAGADWNWGIPRLLISRGESRIAYVLAKGAALTVVLLIGVLVAYAVGVVLAFLVGAILGQPAGNPTGGESVEQLARSLYLGYPVLVERAAIGFAVAVVLRSQLAGVVTGIVLYIGEGILATVLLAIALLPQFGRGGFEGEPIGPEWYQYLPFSIGDSVLAEIMPASLGGGLEDFLVRSVPLETALVFVGLYIAGAVALSLAAVWRRDIST